MQRILSLRQTPLRHSAPLVDGYPPPPARANIYLVGLSHKTAVDALKRVGMTHQIAGKGNWVVAQHIDAEKNKVLLFLSSSPADSLRVPDVTGAPIRQAVVQLTQIGLRVKISGSGRVVDQSPKPGAHVEPGTVCRVECKRES